jgi:hypothetical protein
LGQIISRQGQLASLPTQKMAKVESEVFVKLDDPGDQGKPGLEVYFDLCTDDNAVRRVLSGNILSARKQLAGHWSDLSRLRYNPDKMN